MASVGARPREPCQLCHCKIDGTKKRRNLGVKNSECATACLDRLCSAVGGARAQLVPGPVCTECFKNLEKLGKVQITVDTLTEQFMSYLQGRSTTLQSSMLQSQELGYSEMLPRKRSSTEVGFPSSTSTPTGYHPLYKRPLIMQEASHARKTLEFTTNPGPSGQQQSVQTQSPVVTVVQVQEKEGRTEKKVYRISSMLKRATMDIANGRYTYFARNAMKIPELKSAVVTAVATEVRNECQKLCTSTVNQQSVLRKTSAADMKQFNWNAVVDELQSRAPVLYVILTESVKRYRGKHPREVSQRSIGFAAAILLRERNKFMCAAQFVNSIVLHAGHASKMVYTRMRAIGVCSSHLATLGMLDKLGKDHDYKVKLWQEHLTHGLLTKGGEGTVAPVQISRESDPELRPLPLDLLDLSLESVQDPPAEDPQADETDSQLGLEEEDMETGGSYPHDSIAPVASSVYKIVGDNIDKKVKPRYMRVDKQSEMLNYFHIYGVADRVLPSKFQSELQPGYGELLCLTVEDILPTPADISQMLNNYCVLFARALCEHIPFFKQFADCVPTHIEHKYSAEMSKQSEVVPLGVLFKSEQKNEDMLDILKAVHSYVPMIERTTSEKVVVNEAEEDVHLIQQQVQPILFGGDQMTAERGRSVQNVLSNSDTASARLEGLTLVAEDWHAKMCLYKVYWSFLYRCTSSLEGGTLFQLRNLINRRNVVKDVRNDMNATEDFFETVGVGHILAAAMQFYNMPGIDHDPQSPTLKEAAQLSLSEKWTILSTSIRSILAKYVSSSLSCPHHSDFNPETSDDGVHEYACTVLSMALFVFEFDDAVREGDGDRVYRVWKYLLLIFRSSGRTKYALEALNLHFQHNGLSPRQAFQLTWSRFINSRGGKGGNIACDLHMEHLNRALKTSISGLGANITQNSVARAGKCLRLVMEVCDNFDRANGISPQSCKHSSVSYQGDLALIVKELHEKTEVFKEMPGRRHRSFPTTRRNRYKSIDWKAFTEWFDEKKYLFIEAHTTIDADFMC